MLACLGLFSVFIFCSKIFPTEPQKIIPINPKIAFYLGRAYSNGIYVMNTDGTNVTPLPNNGYDSYAPAWSPDGSKIAYIGRGVNLFDTVFNLNIMNSDGSQQ